MNNVKVTIKKEIRQLLRDKRATCIMFITPLLIPLFVFAFSYIYDNMLKSDDEVTYNVGINYELNDVEKEIMNNISLEVTYLKTEEDLEKAYDEGKINAYVLKQNDKYKIYANKLSEDDNYAITNFISYLDSYNTYLAQNYLNEIGADQNKVYNNVSYELNELNTGSNDLVDYIITFAFIYAIMCITLTAINASVDITAGEKEKGTLETILTFPVKTNELIYGKFLAISIATIITSIISIIFAIVSLNISHNMFDIYKDTVFNFNIGTILLVFIIMISYSLFISGLCVAIASRSKTYKEAQSALTPINMLVLVPMFLTILDINFSNALACIPIISHTVLINNIFIGEVNIIQIVLMFISTIIYVVIILYFISKLYKSEKILFAN